MKNLLVVVVMMCLAVALGCEKRVDKGTQPEYSKEVDGATPVGELAGGGEILNDQKEISRAAKAALPPPSSMPSAKSTSQPSATEEVRQKLAAYTAAAKSGQVDVMLSFVSGGASLKPSLASLAALEPKKVAFRSQVQQKLNMSDLPQDMMEAAGLLVMARLPGMELANVKPEQYELVKQGDRVVVNLPGGQKMFFAQGTDGQWRIVLDKSTESDLAAAGELAKGLANAIDNISPLIDTGSITAENYAAKSKQPMDKFVAPAKAKLMQAAGAPGATSAPAAPATAPAAASPAAPEAP